MAYAWRMAVEMEPERFEELVDVAIAQIPEDLLAEVQNCELVIEARGVGPDADLLGVYDGIPLSERDSWYAGALPDRITIFRDAILELCVDDAEVVEQVRITVWHEVAHYFGIDDHHLDELGYA
jgi:predicted Zn-dependent protease with MMP-like domain